MENREKETKQKDQRRKVACCYMPMVWKWCDNCALKSSEHGRDRWPNTDSSCSTWWTISVPEKLLLGPQDENTSKYWISTADVDLGCSNLTAGFRAELLKMKAVWQSTKSKRRGGTALGNYKGLPQIQDSTHFWATVIFPVWMLWLDCMPLTYSNCL